METACAEDIPDAEAQIIGALLSLLVDPLRVRILSALLATDEMCVGDIARTLNASEDSISYALRRSGSRFPPTCGG